MIFNFTPDPKILLALTHTPMQPLDALCELIDNAIDSFQVAIIQGVQIENPMVIVTLPTRKQLASNSGILRVQDNGPGMTADIAEKSIKAGFSGNNPYDSLGLYGMGFNISTGKLGNVTTLMTSRSDMPFYIKTIIDLEKINRAKDYNLDAFEIPKAETEPFHNGSHGTVIEVADWWQEGNANKDFVLKLVQYGLPKIREEIGRRYSTILRENKIKIIINDERCEPFEHCVWDDSRFVVRKSGNVPAVIRIDKVLGSTKRCGSCTAVLGSEDTECPSCRSNRIRTIDEHVFGWIGIQRYDHDTDFGIDLIRNGRAIRIAEKQAFFEFVDEFKHTTKDYPIDQQTGRIVGEIHLDFVPVDFQKQDFQRGSAEWIKAMGYLRGDSSLQPSQPNASENKSPMYVLYQGYRRIRSFGRGDMYMGFWNGKEAQRIPRETEREYYDKFKQKLPGYYDDAEWWKLVDTADQPPVEELPECPECGAQNLKEAEVCLGCGAMLKSKECVNENCRRDIPLSAASCPHCGANQRPTILEPWVCKVCSKKNLATDDTCQKCRMPRGSNNPLSPDELQKTSLKVDGLSKESLIVKLADGSLSNTVRFDVFSTQKPIVSPATKYPVPLVITKNIGHLTIFVDFSHPYFTKCMLSAEQLIAGEIAMYLYDEKKSLSNYPEHSLSSLTWEVLSENWKDTIELSPDSALKDASVLLSDIRTRIQDILKNEAAYYFNELTTPQKKSMTDTLIQSGIDLSSIGELKDSGGYIAYVPFDFLLTLYKAVPDIFFSGGVWNTSLANGGEELLGHDIVALAREKIIQQYSDYLQDVVYFVGNKYTDPITLQRVKLSVEFLRKGMVE